jgi:hypothetical protein
MLPYKQSLFIIIIRMIQAVADRFKFQLCFFITLAASGSSKADTKKNEVIIFLKHSGMQIFKNLLTINVKRFRQQTYRGGTTLIAVTFHHHNNIFLKGLPPF